MLNRASGLLSVPAEDGPAHERQGRCRQIRAIVQPKTTLEQYIQSVPESTRAAVKSLDHLLKSRPEAEQAMQTNGTKLNLISCWHRT